MDGRTKESIEADLDARVQDQINGENSGRYNYVIGGQGEAEVNVNQSPEDAYRNLWDVGEQCGYYVVKGNWTDFLKVINISLPHGNYIIEYFHNRITAVRQIFERTIKTFPEALTEQQKVKQEGRY